MIQYLGLRAKYQQHGGFHTIQVNNLKRNTAEIILIVQPAVVQ